MSGGLDKPETPSAQHYMYVQTDKRTDEKFPPFPLVIGKPGGNFQKYWGANPQD